MRGKARADRKARDDRAWLAWHTAYLPKMKKPVRLADLMGVKKTKKGAAPKTPSQLQAMAMQWHRALTRQPSRPAKPTPKSKKQEEQNHGR